MAPSLWKRFMMMCGVREEDLARPPRFFSSKSFLKTPSVITGASSSKEGEFSIEMLSHEQQLRLRHSFNRFDADGSGFISAAEMMHALTLLGFNLSRAEFAAILQAIDRNNDGVVDFREFAQVWWKREQEHIEEDFQEELQLAFKIFDDDDSGFISVQELRDKLTTLGERMTNEEVDELLAECDTDGSGQISLSEFKEMPCWRS